MFEVYEIEKAEYTKEQLFDAVKDNGWFIREEYDHGLKKDHPLKALENVVKNKLNITKPIHRYIFYPPNRVYDPVKDDSYPVETTRKIPGHLTNTIKFKCNIGYLNSVIWYFRDKDGEKNNIWVDLDDEDICWDLIYRIIFCPDDVKAIIEKSNRSYKDHLEYIRKRREERDKAREEGKEICPEGIDPDVEFKEIMELMAYEAVEKEKKGKNDIKYPRDGFERQED